MSLGFHGRYTTLDEVLQLTSVGRRGTDAWSLLETARQLGLDGEGVRLEGPEDLDLLEPGTIVHWRTPAHYAVLERFERGRPTVVDPAVGRYRLTQRELRRRFTGVALRLAPSAAFERRAGEPPALTWRQIGALRWRRLRQRSLGLPRLLVHWLIHRGDPRRAALADAEP